jgi:hypothetical protein
MSNQALVLWVIMVAAIVAAASAFAAQHYLAQIRDMLVKPFTSSRPRPDDADDEEGEDDADGPSNG